MVSNPLKNISQLGWLFKIYGKIKVMFQTTNQNGFFHNTPLDTGVLGLCQLAFSDVLLQLRGWCPFSLEPHDSVGFGRTLRGRCIVPKWFIVTIPIYCWWYIISIWILYTTGIYCLDLDNQIYNHGCWFAYLSTSPWMVYIIYVHCVYIHISIYTSQGSYIPCMEVSKNRNTPVLTPKSIQMPHLLLKQ